MCSEIAAPSLARHYLILLYFVVFAGIYKDDGPFDVMIDITQIKELHTVPSASEVCKPLQYFNLIP